MKIETAFKQWFNSTLFTKLNLSDVDLSMMQLAFEKGVDYGFKEAGTRYNLVKKER